MISVGPGSFLLGLDHLNEAADWSKGRRGAENERPACAIAQESISACINQYLREADQRSPAGLRSQDNTGNSRGGEPACQHCTERRHFWGKQPALPDKGPGGDMSGTLDTSEAKRTRSCWSDFLWKRLSSVFRVPKTPQTRSDRPRTGRGAAARPPSPGLFIPGTQRRNLGPRDRATSLREAGESKILPRFKNGACRGKYLNSIFFILYFHSFYSCYTHDYVIVDVTLAIAFSFEHFNVCFCYVY